MEEGDNVSRGRLIAKIDLESINKQKAELESSLSLAKDVYERQKRLWDQKIGSEIQYLQAKNNVERLEKTIATLNHQLTKSNVYAPISGVVEAVVLKAGEVASPGYPIVQLLNTNKLKVVADLSENFLLSVRRGETVEINFPALQKTMKGRIGLVGKTIDPSNRTFKVEVDVQNRDGLLKPNLLAEMKINNLTIKDAIVVPVNLVQQEVGGKSFIMVKGNKDGKDIAVKKYIETGENSDTHIVATSGLDGSEIIIVDGNKNVSDGELIEIANQKSEENVNTEAK